MEHVIAINLVCSFYILPLPCYCRCISFSEILVVIGITELVCQYSAPDSDISCSSSLVCCFDFVTNMQALLKLSQGVHFRNI